VARNRSLSPGFRLTLRWVAGLAWVVLIIWLITLLWPNGSDPGSGNSGSGNSSGQEAGVPNETGTPPTAPAATPPAVPAKQQPAAAASRYGILAITYQGTANEKLATSLAIELRDRLQPQPVQVRKVSGDGKTWYEIFVGEAEEKSALDALLKQVRGLSPSDQPGKKPFTDAFIKRIPQTTSS
jgi:hypothetical protein